MSGETYTYLTEEVIGEFSETGIETLIQHLQAPDQTNEELEETSCLMFTEILLALEENSINREDVLKFLSIAVKDESIAVLFSQVLDIFPVSESIKSLINMLYNKQTIVRPPTLAKYLKPETLSRSNLVPMSTLNRQLNITKRDEFYTQQKYNLLHEESEGFSKYIIELYHIFKDRDAHLKTGYVMEVIEKSIGHYSLDPHRCLDIFLEVSSNHLVTNYRTAIDLLKRSRWWPEVESDISSIHALSHGGNETASKLIALRLVRYPRGKDLPETFKHLVSILIKEGFISFGSIYNYLRPDNNSMTNLESQFKEHLDEEISKSNANALALAAPLKDDDEDESGINTEDSNSDKKTRETSKTSIQESLRYNFMYQMLRVFLADGLYWPSMYILNEYPFLAHIDTEIHELLNRLLNEMIEPVYDSIKSFSDEEIQILKEPQKVAFSRPMNTVSYEDFNRSELLSFKATMKSYGQKKFVFFYSEWSEKLCKMHTTKEFLTECKEIMKFIGVNLSKDLVLFSKVCEIIHFALTREKASIDSKIQWFDFFRNFILPSISLIEENPIAVDQAHSILSLYPIEDRFNLYGELYQVLSKNNPFIKISYGKAEKNTKDILKRLSKENVQPMMRRLAKISYSNPLPCLLTILQQIESYPNLISLVVETARYFNNYGWDVLTIALMIRLTASGRSITQDDGLNDRLWIQSLAIFVGKISQRYPGAIDLSTILTFLLKSLHNNETFGLIVLKEIFQSMGGIQSISNLTSRQVNLINCEGCLERVVYRTIGDMRYERRKSGQILVKTLRKLDVIEELLILLNQLGSSILYDSPNVHLKAISNKNDDFNAVIRLLISTINFFDKKTDDGGHNFLPITDLVLNYSLPIEWAFELWRPNFKTTENLENLSASDRDTIVKLIPDPSLKFITVDLFASFWLLSLHDINFSQKTYDNELERLESNVGSLKETLLLSKREKDIAKSAIEKLRNDLSVEETSLKYLPEDMKKHSVHDEIVGAELKEKSSKWITEGDNQEKVRTFLSLCVLPRAVHSSFDAVFSGNFLFMMLKLETPNFYFNRLFDELIKSKALFGILFTSSSIEAENLGLFFAEILKTLHSWTDEETFISVSSQLKSEEAEKINFSTFKKLLYEYHSTIIEDIGRALEVNEYMSRMNAITFLKNLLGVYPNVEDQCEQIIEMMENIANNDEREDLRLSSLALIGHVKSRTKEWVNLWDFISLSEEEKESHMAYRKRKLEEKENIEREIKEKKAREEQASNDAKEEKERMNRNETDTEDHQATPILSYDDKDSSASRQNPRNIQETKSRYDYYSKFGEAKDLENESSENDPALKKEKDNRTSSETVEEKAESPERVSDLKSRIREAKNELKRKREDTGVTEQSQKVAPRTTARRAGPLPPQKLPIADDGKNITKRTSLAPQSAVARKEQYTERNKDQGVRKQGEYARYQGTRGHGNPSSRTNSASPLVAPTNSQTDALPPPPPPPPEPSHAPNSRYGRKDAYDGNVSYGQPGRRGRYDNKRKQDGYYSNYSDKRQRN